MNKKIKFVNFQCQYNYLYTTTHTHKTRQQFLYRSRMEAKRFIKPGAFSNSYNTSSPTRQMEGGRRQTIALDTGKLKSGSSKPNITIKNHDPIELQNHPSLSTFN